MNERIKIQCFPVFRSIEVMDEMYLILSIVIICTIETIQLIDCECQYI